MRSGRQAAKHRCPRQRRALLRASLNAEHGATMGKPERALTREPTTVLVGCFQGAMVLARFKDACGAAPGGAALRGLTAAPGP